MGFFLLTSHFIKKITFLYLTCILACCIWLKISRPLTLNDNKSNTFFTALKKGREEEGEDRKEEGKGGSTRPFLAREPNSSTASNYEPASSQMLEKGKLLYWSNLDIFHIIRTYRWERLEWEGIHSICNCLFSVFPRNSFPSFSTSHHWFTCVCVFYYSSMSVAPKPDTQHPAGKQSETILSQIFSNNDKNTGWMWRRKQLGGVHITYLTCSPEDFPHTLSTRNLCRSHL